MNAHRFFSGLGYVLLLRHVHLKNRAGELPLYITGEKMLPSGFCSLIF